MGILYKAAMQSNGNNNSENQKELKKILRLSGSQLKKVLRKNKLQSASTTNN